MTTRRPSGMTLVETLIALALFASAMTIIQLLVFGGGRSYGRAQARLDLVSASRTAIDRVAADARKCGSRMRVTDDGNELTLSLLRFDARGLPLVDATGHFVELDVRYQFDAARKQLLRDGEVVASGLPDLQFSQSVVELHGTKIPQLTIEVTGLLEGRPLRLASTAIPRLASGWAANPAWVLTTLGAPYEFRMDQ